MSKRFLLSFLDSTEKLEIGYDLSPIARFESDAGSAKPKGRPPSMPGPSPYSSNEHLYTRYTQRHVTRFIFIISQCLVLNTCKTVTLVW